MPYKDPEQRKAANRRATQKARSRTRPEGVCTAYPACTNIPEPGFKRCPKCLAYMREYKKKYRQKEVPPGTCSRYPDCANPTDGAHKLCLSCLASSKTVDDACRPSIREKHNRRCRDLKASFIAAYGGRCLCCGETRPEFLTADHVGGWKDGPRKGAQLYAHAKKLDYPTQFRLLCLNCNFSLGHYGYCPHGHGLTQEHRVGKRSMGLTPEAKRIANKKRYAQLREETFGHYGTPPFHCACCGEQHREFLGLDHVNNDGAHHRKTACGNNLYFWLRNNGYPEGFQILCHNCNFTKGHFKSCPHHCGADSMPPTT